MYRTTDIGAVKSLVNIFRKENAREAIAADEASQAARKPSIRYAPLLRFRHAAQMLDSFAPFSLTSRRQLVRDDSSSVLF